MIIKFNKQDLQTCEEFANNIKTGFYATRNQFNNEKRIKDNIIGKLGELAIFYYFKNKNVELTQPDFKIYSASKKSWDYDLKGTDLNLHVKSQSIEQGKKYGVSWIFENTDRHIFKEVLDSDYVCFVVVDLNNASAEIKSIIKLTDLHHKELFKKPKLAYLTTKSAVYFDDIKQTLKDNLCVK